MNHLPGVCSMVAAFLLPHSSLPGEPCPPQRLGLGENQAAEGDGAVAQELAAQLRPGNVHSAEGGEESATSRRKPGEASRGDGEVSEKSFGKQIKVPVGSIPKAQPWLPDGALASEVQNCGCIQASGAYTAVAQDAKMEILG